MPEFLPSERFKPSLFDRLTDYHPDPKSVKEAGASRTFSQRDYVASVKRDLLWLMSTMRLERSGELDDFPQVASSVLNFGTPSITGCVSGTLKLDEVRKEMKRGYGRHGEGARLPGIEWELREAIESFEPRIDPSTLSVTVLWQNIGDPTHDLHFLIKADLIMEPTPEPLDMRTTLDLETGELKSPNGR